MDVRVLEVMRLAMAGRHESQDMREARAAVAELMSEAQRVVDGTAGDLHYLRTALARCNGGAA